MTTRCIKHIQLQQQVKDPKSNRLSSSQYQYKPYLIRWLLKPSQYLQPALFRHSQ